MIPSASSARYKRAFQSAVDPGAAQSGDAVSVTRCDTGDSRSWSIHVPEVILAQMHGERRIGWVMAATLMVACGGRIALDRGDADGTGGDGGEPLVGAGGSSRPIDSAAAGETGTGGADASRAGGGSAGSGGRPVVPPTSGGAGAGGERSAVGGSVGEAGRSGAAGVVVSGGEAGIDAGAAGRLGFAGAGGEVEVAGGAGSSGAGALIGGAGGETESGGAAGAGGGGVVRAVAVTVGNFHSCALTNDQRVLCWGGVGEEAPPFGLAEVPSGRYTAVDAGIMHTCALRVDGTVVCWGIQSSAAPDLIPSGQFADVAGGISTSCGLRLDGSIECWSDSGVPDVTLLPGGRYVELELSGPGLAAVDENGNAYCVSPVGRYPVDLIGGYSHPAETNDAFCAISLSGDVDCITWDGAPMAGSGLPSGVRYVALDASGDQMCGLQETGAIQCIGPPAPSQIYVDLAVGYAHHCAIRDDGGVDCWPNPDMAFSDHGQYDVPAELR